MRRALLALAGLLVLAPAAQAATPRVVSTQAISGRTPFPQGCGVTGEQTPDSEAEPYVAVDPRDADRVIAVFQQDRFAVDGGALANLEAHSSDGGRTWATAPLPRLSRCSGGARERASDPWIAFGAEGVAYSANLTFDENPALGNAGLAGPTALSSMTSRDGGRTWAAPVPIVDENIYDDREAIAADPARPGHAYVVWVRRLGSFGENGTLWFSRTVDGAKTWTTGQMVYSPGPLNLTDPILLHVLHDGTLLATFVVLDDRSQVGQTVPFKLLAIRSTDEGRTWSDPATIGSTTSTEPEDPDSGAPIRSLPIISTAVEPDGGVDVAWNDIHAPDSSDLRLARSTDDGKTWSSPKLVKHVAGQAFLPAAAVGRDGTIGVLYDDTRNDKRGDGRLTTDVWLSASRDGGKTWSEGHVSGPFDALTASETSSTGVAGHFLGDYQGLVALPNAFGAVFAAAKPVATAGPSDILFARVALDGSAPKAAASRRIVLRVSPARVRPGHRVRIVFRATRGGRAARAVRVEFAGRRLHTDGSGRASVRVRLTRTGRRRAHASRKGLRSADAYVLVTRAGRARVRAVDTR